jgi:hypothetical protein
MTLAMLWTLLKNRYVQYVLIGIGVFLLLIAVRQHYINIGKDAGRQEVQQQSANMLEDARKADRAATEKVLADSAAEMKRQAEFAQAQQLAFLQLVAQRQTAANQVAGMTPSQVEDAIARALGKKPGEQDSEQDRRTIASCLFQMPLCERQVLAQADQIKADEKQLAAAKESSDALAGYATRLEKTYADLWNLKAGKRRSAKCLFLWRCSREHIDAPDPETLKGTKPK